MSEPNDVIRRRTDSDARLHVHLPESYIGRPRSFRHWATREIPLKYTYMDSSCSRRFRSKVVREFVRHGWKPSVVPWTRLPRGTGARKIPESLC